MDFYERLRVFYKACENGNAKTAKKLMKPGINLHVWNEGLNRALRKDQVKILRLLIRTRLPTYYYCHNLSKFIEIGFGEITVLNSFETKKFKITKVILKDLRGELKRYVNY
jgi:hypothetical protein